MRSLALKLTLAFLLVGVIGVVLFAVLVGQRTQAEVSRFLSARDQAVLLDSLGDYYGARGNWDGVRDMLARSPSLSYYSHDIALIDANRRVVLGNQTYAAGQVIPEETLDTCMPVQNQGEVVGYVQFPGPAGRSEFGSGPRPPPEADLWNRIGGAALASGLITAAIALIVGGVLARTLTRPVRELTVATKAMASGKLDQRVAVHSRDEIGELATAFNHMSADLARGAQLRKQMTADLAHDLRTPLSILRGYTEGLKEERIDGSPTIYAIMHDEVEHLQRLVEDLRTLSLADAGELPLNRRRVDPKALLERAGLAHIMQAEQQGVALEVEADHDLPSIDVDTDRMAQVLNNLVTNALRHTTQGRVVLSARRDGQHVQLKVADTGAGIAPPDLPFVFDRFYRADPSRQRIDDDSSGLGLAISKAIVEAHGGAITVASALGQGTTFTITLPIK
jgi:two-component system sensor histidine kinase BaeS